MGGVIAWLARSKFPFNPRRRPNRLPLTRSQWSSHLASSSPYWATPRSLVRSAPRALSRRRSNPPATSTHATPCIVTASKQLIAKHTACPRLSKPANSESATSATQRLSDSATQRLSAPLFPPRTHPLFPTSFTPLLFPYKPVNLQPEERWWR